MTRNTLCKIFALIAVCTFFSFKTSRAEDSSAAVPEPGEIIEKFYVAAESVKSCSFDAHRYDYADKFVKKRHKDGLEDYKFLLDKLRFLTRKKDKAGEEEKEYMETVSVTSFVAPFLIQMTLKINDYLPSFLEKAIAIYRPDVNADEAFMKDPIIGLLFRKGVETDSCVVMVINWVYDRLELDCAFANGGVVSYAGLDTLETGDAYHLEINLKNGVVPWEAGCKGKTYGAPEPTHFQLNRELGMISERIDTYTDAPGTLGIWIDAESWLIVKKEMHFNGIPMLKQSINNIKLNNLKADDLMKGKKAKKKKKK